MKYNYIAIEREYASGGTEIGEKLAEALGIPCYGREILEEVARENGTTPEQIQDLEESSNGSLLYSIAMVAKMMTGESSGISQENALYMAEAKTIYRLSQQGSGVFIGRCAGWVMKDRTDVLKVFIHAEPVFRRKRAAEIYGIHSARIENILKKFDKRRSNFYNANTGKKWDDKSGYHLILDSSRLGIDQCVEILRTVVCGK